MFEIEVQRVVFVYANLDGLGYMGGRGDGSNRDRPPDIGEAVASVGTYDHGLVLAVLESHDRSRQHWPVFPAVAHCPG